MKYFTVCAVGLITAAIGYYCGLRTATNRWDETAKQKLVEECLMNHLLCNIAVYEDLEKAGPGLAKDSLKVYIKGDVMTYDFYRREVPTFGDKTEHLQEFVSQGRAIGNEK